MFKNLRKHSERGQAIILVAFSIVGLVAIVGLMIDGGIMLIEYARLKRGLDAASIAAASQFRKGFNGQDLEKAGEEFMLFNQSVADVTIFTCDTPNTSWDEALCAPTGMPKRKLVRVTASRVVDFGFMRVVGFDSTTLTASSIGEAASIDLVLLIDTSSSMAYETTVGGDPLRSDIAVPGTHTGDDPVACNASATRRCEPLGRIKTVAIDFIQGNLLFFPYDRVAVVATTQQQQDFTATRLPHTVTPFRDNQGDVEAAINNLKVFLPQKCPASYATGDGPCVRYDASNNYVGQRCITTQRAIDAGTPTVADPTSCGPSNIGGGLYEAGFQFANARTDSFWVVIALIGGPANAAVLPTESDANVGFCPGDPGEPTWYFPLETVGGITYPAGYTGYCRDRSSTTRHLADRTDPENVIYPTNYDADDFARDAADFIAAPQPNGQGAVIFSICLGQYCQNYPSPDGASGENLGRYLALNAGDDLTETPPIIANHGLYQYAQDSSQLGTIFEKISDNIFTRISK
jgi:Flp pilus assembly protein TadG